MVGFSTDICIVHVHTWGVREERTREMCGTRVRVRKASMHVAGVRAKCVRSKRVCERANEACFCASRRCCLLRLAPQRNRLRVGLSRMQLNAAHQTRRLVHALVRCVHRSPSSVLRALQRPSRRRSAALRCRRSLPGCAGLGCSGPEPPTAVHLSAVPSERSERAKVGSPSSEAASPTI